MDLKQLEHFVRIAELGSVSRAAIALGIAQPALSRQVRALEGELRRHLFHRHGRGVTLTEAGELMLTHARNVLHEMQTARERLDGLGDKLAGHVTFGMPPGIAKMLTSPLTREIRRRLPHASVTISEGSTTAMRELLIAGRVDMALLYRTGPLPELAIERLRDERLYLIGARGMRRGVRSGRIGRVALRDIAALPLIMPSRPSAIRVLVESELAALGLAPDIAFEIEGATGILDVVRDGAGYAILPLSSVAAMPKPGVFQLRALCDPDLSCELALATALRRPASRTQSALRALLVEVLQDALPGGGVPDHAPA